MHVFNEALYGTALMDACTKTASIALRVHGGSDSSDVVETVASSFAECARTYANRVHDAGLEDRTLVDVVHFVADLLTHGEVGTDVRWFDASLDALLELAAPSRRRTPDAQRFIDTVKCQA